MFLREVHAAGIIKEPGIAECLKKLPERNKGGYLRSWSTRLHDQLIVHFFEVEYKKIKRSWIDCPFKSFHHATFVCQYL